MAIQSLVSSVQMSPKFQNILFATDFSSCSAKALPYARAMARRYGSTIHLVHVMGAEPLIGSLGGPVQDLEIEHQSAQEQMEEFAQFGALEDILHTQTLERGEVWDVILRLVSELHIDLIVLGTHGRRGMRHFVLGSVAEQVFRCAPCPVLTVGPEVHDGGFAQGRIDSVLYATDFSPGSLRAFDYALSLARSSSARLTLVHAITNDLLLNFASETTAFMEQRLGMLMPRDTGISHDIIAGFGAATDMILKAAKDTHADVIVMGARKGAAGSSHAPWATAHKVVCYASCPALTVRE